ncbi:MAG TPA: UDP-N-acetylglucosamine 2-epimerase (hydrolyzing) [Lachnospiraceae bacterium]|nr:UDP-N-acetylglucosamine 2-epimerase (hydrolyzing) [Lachnospiraceae bacterium]
MQTNDNNSNNRIIFLTGTRADYGKLKSLIRIVNDSDQFEAHIFATGMHMLSRYGSTYKEIIKDGFPNIYTFVNQNTNTPMDLALSNTITGFSNYIAELKPIAIVVHGDRLEALAGAIVGALNNIRVFHIEGGEVSGTIDESIRHAITKFSHYHFVANETAKKRIMQLGEPEENIFIFGSPDIDIMHSDKLPTLDMVKSYYNITFDNYNIVLYHPVTTETSNLAHNVKSMVNTLIESGLNYVVIYPNNDFGNKIILHEYERLLDDPHFRLFPSMRFEYFLTLLKNADSIIGNSSSGIREACIYGIPALDLGNRQAGRYRPDSFSHIHHTNETDPHLIDILQDTIAAKSNLTPQSYFGNGNSDKLFLDILLHKNIWHSNIQKRFIDIDF